MKRICALLLSVCLLVSMIPVNAISMRGTEVSSDGVVTAGTAYATPGTTVSIDLEIRNNPGILGMTLKVEYDESKAILTGVENGTALSYMTFTTPKALGSGCQLPWDAEEVDAESLEDGVIATLTFQILETVNENTSIDICLSYDAGAIIDENMKPLSITLENGKVQVISYTPGDVNEDGLINSTDVVYLRRYIAGGYGVTINEAAADVNDDGLINTTDAVYIRRFVAGGYGIILKPHTPRCTHTMEAIPEKAATCTEDGNSAYYHCTTCGKYYKDSNGSKEITEESTVIAAKGHTVVIDPYVAPTPTTPGLTEGSHCSVCGLVIVEQEEIPNGYTIRYNLPSNDSYLTALEKAGALNNPNPETYTASKGVDVLEDLVVAGYDFYGWYTEPNGGGTRYARVPVGTTGTLVLYAHMTAHEYKITYNLYQTPVEPITGDEYKTYTVNKGNYNLPNPEVYNYIFLGWYTKDGTEVNQIPVGSTGDITLYAYWTSKRNLCKSVGKLEDPIVLEDVDNDVIYFTYELGTIENVPLSDAIWSVDSVYGLTQQVSETYTTSISETQAQAISDTISQSTVNSSTWMLSKEWADEVDVNTQWEEKNGVEIGTTIEKIKSSSGTISITDSEGWKDTVTKTDGTTTVTYDSQNEIEKSGAELEVKDSVKLSGKLGLGFSKKKSSSFSGALTGEAAEGIYKLGANLGLGSGTEKGWSINGELGGEVIEEISLKGYTETSTNKHTGTDTTEVETTVEEDERSWNSSTTQSATVEASERDLVQRALSSVITETKGYGKTYSEKEMESDTQGFSSTDSTSVNSSSSVTYSKVETKTVTKTYATDGKSEGRYRLILAGKFHVFGVVGYDIATKSYFTYTYSVMDDEGAKEFLDYTAKGGDFTEDENTVLPFEIPYTVHDYVSGKVAYTEGLEFNPNSIEGTATVDGYIGDSKDVIIPTYYAENGYSYKVVGIESGVFAGKDIQCVMMGEYIDEIPAGAFYNCTALEEVSGYFTKIGNNAFNGCTALENFMVSSVTTEIGTGAFEGVPSITVNALCADAAMAKGEAEYPDESGKAQTEYAMICTQEVIHAAVQSGAESVTLDLSQVIEDIELTIEVGNISSFTLRGGGKAYQNLQIQSDAAATVLEAFTVVNSMRTPLVISSDSLTLQNVYITSPGYVLLYSAVSPEIIRISDSKLVSQTGDAVVCRMLILSGNGTLNISGNVYVCGTAEDVESLNNTKRLSVTNGEIQAISETEYAQKIKGSVAINFDACGGTVSPDSKTINCGSAIGELPIPERTGYVFTGWFTEDGEKVTSSFTVTVNMTLYAHWDASAFTASWESGTGYTITVNRTKSPYADADIGELNNGEAIYYGDELRITYAADPGYEIVETGDATITVTGYVDSSMIYAKVEAIDVTYKIVYVSSNGTNLGSSTVTEKYGTTNTITPPAKSGYDTPSSQKVEWDSIDAKTITFTYSPSYVGDTWKYGYITDDANHKMTYDVVIEYRNRTATSVELYVTWTATMWGLHDPGPYNAYGQYFKASVGSVSTGNVNVVPWGTWSSRSVSARSETAGSGWFEVDLSTTDATSLAMSVYYWQTNYNGDDMSYTLEHLDTTWYIDIPAY